jgi:glyoxylase-like metal-dependent hydrolase (beta-lactamase superfamily II)
MSLPDFVEPLSPGLYAIDTGFHRPRFDAAYLLVDSGRGAFIDTGTNYAVPRLLQAADALGLAREAIDWVIPTHVHLDHAGGSGLLMQALPQATLLVHPRGARHLIDPSALYAGALAVYGQQEMDRSYGQLVAVDEARVAVSHDGQQIQVGQRSLELIDTPGHARHHHCIWDVRTEGWFTGDTFGLSYREFDRDGQTWILPTSTPVQFEPDVLIDSVERLLARRPRCMYLTHYGRVTDPHRLWGLMRPQLDAMVRLALEAPAGAQRHTWLAQRFAALYVASLREHGCTMSDAAIEQMLALDIDLNTQGACVWLDRRRSAAPPAGSRG